MKIPEVAALLLWSSALIAILALLTGSLAAPRECRYSPEDFAACDGWRQIDAIGGMILVSLTVSALALTRERASSGAHTAARLVGALGAIVAIIGCAGTLVSELYVPARPVATAGFGLLGGALLMESLRGRIEVRSRLGIILGGTLVLWATAYVLRDDLVMPTGGILFAFAYAIWATRLGYRFTFESKANAERRLVVRSAASTAAAILVVFLAFPFWLSSTFGVAVLGDPANEVTIRNETDGPIVFYPHRGLPTYSERIEVGESKASIWLEHAVYPTAAEDATGTEIFCRRIHNRELRRAHYAIVVVRDPASCGTP